MMRRWLAYGLWVLRGRPGNFYRNVRLVDVRKDGLDVSSLHDTTIESIGWKRERTDRPQNPMLKLARR